MQYDHQMGRFLRDSRTIDSICGVRGLRQCHRQTIKPNHRERTVHKEHEQEKDRVDHRNDLDTRPFSWWLLQAHQGFFRSVDVEWTCSSSVATTTFSASACLTRSKR